MRRKSLIYTHTVRSWSSDPVRLEYYLLNDSILDGCAESYGVEIRAESSAGRQYAGVQDVTTVGSRILELLDLLSGQQVTPAGLYDAVCQWESGKCGKNAEKNRQIRVSLL